MTSAEADGTGERYECGVCWHVYDPAEGDDVGQIAPGTGFEALPDDWRCPTCDGAKHKYMRIGDDR
ncbi:MAG: rubredoxin [Ancalomicrobiaceae bacterium]|nr:rubredoxin [Ancalomicrobiaceae bacterium]